MMKTSIDFGLLFLRVATGLMMIFPHGWGKLVGFGAKMNVFPDPLGVSSPVSMALAVFAEFFCQIFIIVGLKTRWVAIPSLITMLVAAFMVHANDPWKIKEKAIMYAIIYLALAITGGGKFSVKE